MPNCSVLICKNRSVTTNLKTTGVSYHRYPKEPYLKLKWIDATGRDSNWFPSYMSVICSTHFEEDCFKQTRKRRKLIKTAVPTLKLKYIFETPGAQSETLDDHTNPSREASTSTTDTYSIKRLQSTKRSKMPRKKINLDYMCTTEDQHKHDKRLQTTDQTAVGCFYLEVCRACLATRVKMHNITEQGLGDMYKQVTGIEINIEDNLPRVLCWECVARLSNANNFIENALRTRLILTSRQITNGESLTINSITSMNKTEYGLSSTLGYKFFNGNYADVYINHDTVEGDSDVTHLSNNKGIDEAGVDREVVDSIQIFTSSDHAYIVTYEEANANNINGIKSEPLDLDINLHNEVYVKEECFSDEEMVDESNKDMSQETIKELELSDSATSDDHNKSHTSIKERIKFEENIVETFTNSTEIGSKNNSNPSDHGNTSMDVNNRIQYICDICSEAFVCKNHIRRHLENHPETFNCSFCAYKTSHKDHLTIHTNAEHTRGKELHCSFCSYTTYYKNTLQEHIHALHIKKQKISLTNASLPTTLNQLSSTASVVI